MPAYRAKGKRKFLSEDDLEEAMEIFDEDGEYLLTTPRWGASNKSHKR
ncbi:MAG: hypothetical protein ACP5HQ_07635 [Thermoprotei archaeon]